MHLSCTEIVEGLKKGGIERNKCIDIIHEKYLYLVKPLSKKYHLDVELAIHEYIDAILTLDDYVRNRGFQIKDENSCLNFLSRTFDNKCQNLKRRMKNKQDKELSLGEFDWHLTIANEENDAKLDETDLLKVFNNLDIKCQNILMDWIYKFNMTEIAEENELANANTAGVTKKRCLDKLKEIFSDEGYR